jgi:predicted RNA binding protein YcfA (HicA-like mRNA interferase family)
VPERRLPRVTAAQVLRALQREGWFIARQSGSHAVLRHSDRPGRVVVSRHAGLIVKPRTLSGIIREAGLSVEEFRALL